ncbi:hypothetical protein SZN_09466 [Streptomyces zinciresistens K42]|uniref:Uncharacterized protein n=1 Tax=Streptomyces zinciresistens K42 TaxID=700597 RepID=G2G8S5_9ACTN|nr:hypothetical protein [Streptomyces zinciresistens]EGX60140.1 hypothetical protein SZN_09466 [Streptomyces zinciresistens K42]
MTDTTTGTALPGPTPQEIEAAARILMRAWAPGHLLPGDHPKDIAAGSPDDYDDQDPDEYCGCAGTDDDGESLGCNCGGGCVCDECSYQAHAQYKRCWVKGCGKAPAFRVTRFSLVDQYVQEPTRRGAVCPHPQGTTHWCTPSTVYVEAGPSVQEFAHQPACSIAHAVQLRDACRQSGRDGRDLYRIETWTYAPHDRELPAPLPALRERTSSAREATASAIRQHAAGRRDEYWLPSARRHLAVAVWSARLDLARPGEDHDVWDDQPSTPVQEEPSEPDPTG